MSYAETHIACRMLRTEEGRTYNALIEQLAMALFKDRHPNEKWHEASHSFRERFRDMAEGNAPLPPDESGE